MIEPIIERELHQTGNTYFVELGELGVLICPDNILYKGACYRYERKMFDRSGRLSAWVFKCWETSQRVIVWND